MIHATDPRCLIVIYGSSCYRPDHVKQMIACHLHALEQFCQGTTSRQSCFWTAQHSPRRATSSPELDKNLLSHGAFVVRLRRVWRYGKSIYHALPPSAERMPLVYRSQNLRDCPDAAG